MFHVERTRILCHTSASDVASINRLSPILAIAVGVLHAGLAPVLAAADVRPNIALVAVVLVTCWSGARTGATWAFVAGLTVNVLSAHPVGSIPLSLLVAAALAAAGRPLLASLGWIPVVAAVVLGSVAADGTLLVIARAVGGPAGALPLNVVAVGAALNGALALAAIVAVSLIRRERARPDRVRGFAA